MPRATRVEVEEGEYRKEERPALNQGTPERVPEEMLRAPRIGCGAQARSGCRELGRMVERF